MEILICNTSGNVGNALRKGIETDRFYEVLQSIYTGLRKVPI
jgi:hypothetical protein